jgi:hypothetical protein
LRALVYIFISLLSILILFRCSSTRYLKKDEFILYENSIKNAPKEESDALTEQYKQKSNRRFLGYLLYVKIYNTGKFLHDTSELKKEIVLINELYEKKQTPVV